jgi:segregation and condensation protein A
MPLALAQDAIALLIDLAERGEIDPWDVKVIDVIDRFLRELDPFEQQGQKLYEANLSQSGQAFLYASMLLLLKADNLTQAEAASAADSVEDEPEVFEGDDANAAPLPPNLERRLSRRAVAPPPRHRRVTLKELIDQLQTIAAALDAQTSRVRLKRPRQSRAQAIRAIAQLAHQENLSEMAAALEQFFADHAETATEDWLDFNLLVELWVQAQSPATTIGAQEATQAENPNHDRVGVFWALLLLCAQSKVELVQETFYHDLKVRRLPECPGPA